MWLGPASKLSLKQHMFHAVTPTVRRGKETNTMANIMQHGNNGMTITVRLHDPWTENLRTESNRSGAYIKTVQFKGCKFATPVNVFAVKL